MSHKNDIVIQCWTGKILFEGNYKDKKVDKVLNANRCPHCKKENKAPCLECDDTGYKGDFTIYWKDETNQNNVYEYINY